MSGKWADKDVRGKAAPWRFRQCRTIMRSRVCKGCKAKLLAARLQRLRRSRPAKSNSARRQSPTYVAPMPTAMEMAASRLLP